MNDETTPQIPPELLSMLEIGRVRNLEDVVDLAAAVSSGIVQRAIPTAAARELRHLSELMYTCIQSKNSDQTTQANFVAQLVQIANDPPKKIEEKEQKKLAIELVDIPSFSG